MRKKMTWTFVTKDSKVKRFLAVSMDPPLKVNEGRWVVFDQCMLSFKLCPSLQYTVLTNACRLFPARVCVRALMTS